ncbi:MAG: orotidine-5'-phosphate decarboxylase [bacterium]|nr:orotidine-5'-phosphate decarboxylase [bacterium]
MVTSPIIVAIDTSDRPSAIALADAVSESVGAFKIGLGLLHGPGSLLIRELVDLGRPVFADAKLHDIPSQVERAAFALGRAGARWVTVHASGGVEMMQAAVEGLASGSNGFAKALAVSVLTSLDGPSLSEVGIEEQPQQLVTAMAGAAERAGAEGLVCSPQEIRIVKQATSVLQIVTPGVRPGDSPVGDQRRTATPRQAMDAGADWLVIGRPISAAPDPREAAAEILADLNA